MKRILIAVILLSVISCSIEETTINNTTIINNNNTYIIIGKDTIPASNDSIDTIITFPPIKDTIIDG